MVFIRKKHHHFQAKVRIPLPLRPSYDDREFLYLTLATSDSKAAKAQAEAWEAGLRLQWLASPAASSPLPSAGLAPAQLRALYHDLRKRAEAGEFLVHAAGQDPVEAGIEWEINRIAEAHERDEELPEEAEFRLAAFQDAKTSLQDLPVPRRKALESTFRELADDHLRLWKTQHGLKDTNTEQQKIATFDLFAGFYGSKPIRGVGKADAATFVDALRQMNPNWARSPAAKKMTWAQLQKSFGGRPKGLSDSTINRHVATLQALWDWASERGHCEGHNPFKGFRRKLKEGRNAQGYVAWEAEELTQLFSPPPKRADLTEVMLVAMHSGMRLDEIASLTVGQVHKDGSVPFMRVIDAKTMAGNRDVPVHPALSWLLTKAQGKPTDRIWPGFNAEGPGKKPGADAGKEFSRFKAAKGFTERRNAFHSFRKNFVGQLERARVPEGEVAQVVGHEKKGMTFGTYGGALPIERAAEIVAMIDYPGVSLPVPEAYRPKPKVEREGA